MLLHFHDNLRICDLKEKFELCFSRLKLEFFSYSDHSDGSSSCPDILDDSTRLGDILTYRAAGKLAIRSFFTVEQVEQEIKNTFGLHAQIFRKERGRWIETSKTSKYTLQQQIEMSANADVSSAGIGKTVEAVL